VDPGAVSVGRGTRALDASGYHRRVGAVSEVNLGHPIVTNGDFAA